MGEVRPITVTRSIASACDPNCRLHLDFLDGTTNDSSCDERGPGSTTLAPIETFPGNGLKVVIDNSAASFTLQGRSYDGADLIQNVQGVSDRTIEVLLTPGAPYDIIGTGGTTTALSVFQVGVSAGVTDYSYYLYVEADGSVSLVVSFVGTFNFPGFFENTPVHFCVQKPATVDASNPERYFINGVQVYSRTTRHSVGSPDTLTLGGRSGSAPSGAKRAPTYHGLRVSNSLVYPHDGSSFTPPTRLKPPRWATSIGDPVVTVGAPVVGLETAALGYTVDEANPWGWGQTGSVESAVAVDTNGTAAGNAPEAIPTSVSWVVDFPPYPGANEPTIGITFDETSWALTGSVETDYRTRDLTASGTFLPRVFWSDPAWLIATELGEKSLTAEVDAGCEALGAFSGNGFATIGGFLSQPPGPACGVKPPLDTTATPYAITAPTVAGGVYPASDFAVTTYVGRVSDQFTLTIESIDDLPMTLTGIDWTGWFFNNTRRI
jgi:hypothetical protein